MSKNWRHLEILIGLIFILSGALIAYYLINSMVGTMDLYGTSSNRAKAEYLDAYLLSVISVMTYILVVFPGLQIMAGALLLMRMKSGWITSLCVCINYLIVLFIIGFQPGAELSVLWIINSIGFALVLIIIALLSKPYLLHYKPSIANWLIIPALSNLIFALFQIWQ